MVGIWRRSTCSASRPTGSTATPSILRAGSFRAKHSGRKVVRERSRMGRSRPVAECYEGGRLSSPNDVVVKSDGSIWFTDPDYGVLVPGIGDGEMLEQDRNRLYRVDPATGQVDSMCEEFDKPNGLAFSPDESVLYVGDSGQNPRRFPQSSRDDIRRGRRWRQNRKPRHIRLSSIRLSRMACEWTPTAICTSPQATVYRCFRLTETCSGRFTRRTWQPTARSACLTTKHCS